MNLILVDKDEIGPGGAVHLEGRRAEHILGVLRPELGQVLKVGIVGGSLGEGTVVALGDGRVSVCFVPTDAAETFPARHLVLALPRPPTLKKILQQGTALGLTSIHLIRSARVEKSYFQSPLLKDEALEKQLRLGLEQARDNRLPDITIHRRFRPFAEEILPGLLRQGVFGLLAHPTSKVSLMAYETELAGGTGTLLAIGPEGGWVPFEIELLSKVGLKEFSLGPRILRSETATIAALSQLSLLQTCPGPQDTLR